MFQSVWHFLIVFAPVWIPLLALLAWFDVFVHYKRRAWIKKEGSALLEIKLPHEIFKSPAAIEAILNVIYEPVGGSNLIKVFLEGALRPWYSLEMVSIDGHVHFYIWCHKKYKSIIETQMYAQFPNIEVHEAVDYSLGVYQNPDKLKIMYFGQLELLKPDAYPIKTYVDYGLDKDPDEEYKIDPLVPLLEFLGSLKQGEQVWVQILIRAHTKEGLMHGRFITKPDWKKEANKEIKKFIKENAPAKESKIVEPTVRDLTEEQKETVTAIERNLNKLPYDTMIRMAYLAEPGKDNSANIGGLIRSFRRFGSSNSNGVKPSWDSSLKYPQFQDFRKMKQMRNEREILEAYKRRSFFERPFRHFHGKPFILTVEELATLYHFPSSTVAATPTLARLPSKKGQSPTNLPV